MSVYSVNVYPSSTTIKTGNWYYGAYAIVNASSNCNTDVRWYSNNTNVATVNASSGYIYAKAPGTARIYAQSTVDSSKKDYITVTVTSGTICVDSVTLNRSSISLEKGDTFTLSATVCPTNATNKSIGWRSSNTSVATVSGGVVTAKARGYAYIYAEAQDGSGEYDSCYVNVTEDILVTSVTVSPSSKTMNIGNSAYLYETVCPTNATNKCVRWSSNKTSVATVNPDTGLVIAQGPGTATITATAQDGSNKKGYCTITVNPPVAVTGVEVCPASLTMSVGDIEYLCASITPSNATNQTVTWCSSNENVATVGLYTGRISANMAGTTTITATAADGGYSASCTLYISVPKLFEELVESGKISSLDIKCTDDGFFMCEKSLSYILNNAGIYDLLDNVPCNMYYDDWYLYSIYDGTTDAYSLVKMREQETDNYDNNDPGVTISFISFNTNIFLNCLYNQSNSNKEALYNEIQRVVQQTGQTHNTVLQQYFNNPASVASYNIAELYIQHIADSSNGSQINLPNKYLDILEDIASYERLIEQLEGRTDSGSQMSVMQARAQIEELSRIPNFIASINQNAGYTVCDGEKITIQSPCCLSNFEKYAILATHTGNVSLNSFAAEVKYHAYALETWYGDLNLLGAYEKAIRADMAIGEEYQSGITDQYYDLNSDIVQEQILYHGQK